MESLLDSLQSQLVQRIVHPDRPVMISHILNSEAALSAGMQGSSAAHHSVGFWFCDRCAHLASTCMLVCPACCLHTLIHALCLLQFERLTYASLQRKSCVRLCAGPAGQSVREICKKTGADIKSWTDTSVGGRSQPTRMYVIEVSSTPHVYMLCMSQIVYGVSFCRRTC